MSYYTKFQDVEVSLTATTTTAIGATDVVLGYSQTLKKAIQLPVYGFSGYQNITTSTSTAAPIVAAPGTVVVTAAASAQFMLSTPANPGIYMNFFNASSTSTWNAIMSESTAVVFFTPGGTAGGSNSVQLTSSFQSFGIVSGVSSSGATGGSWYLTYKSTAVAST